MNIASVLVVDDDITVCRILNRMLSDEQYQVQISQSVGDAVAVIGQKPFDAYVLDYKLPDGTGLDIAERIRSTGSQAPIILISGYEASTVALRAGKLHIFEVIEKPFSRETVCSAVKKAIGFSPPMEVAQHASASVPVSGLVEPFPEKKKRFPTAAMIGIVCALLLLVCLALYFFTPVFGRA